MYGLRSWLEIKGQIVYINAKFENHDFIAVYPEIYNGNEAGADTVVRYILQTPGLMSSYGIPSPTTEEYRSNPIYKNDHFYVFSKIYDTFGVGDDRLLFLPILNLHIFKNSVKKRTKTCYLVGKGVNQHKHPQDAVELTREFAKDQVALANLLNECHTLYCYDRLSAMMDIARLCGCKVRYYGDFDKKDLEKYETGMNGLTYRDEEEVDLRSYIFRCEYEQMRNVFSKKLDKFIEYTQEN